MAKISKIKFKGVIHEIKDDEAYVKPASGIPASDIASGVIPDVSAFITKSVNDLTNYYTKTKTEELIGSIIQFHYEIYSTLPATGRSNVLYLIGPTGSGTDKYEEYVYPNSTTGWVKIGDTSIDLSGYVTTTALNNVLTNYTLSTDIPVEKGTGINSVKQKGTGTIASGAAAFAEGGDNLQGGEPATGEEKLFSKAEGYASHSEGAAHAIGRYSHAEGGGNRIEQGHPTRSTAEGQYSHAEGSHTYAKGGMTHAEGNLTIAEGYGSHAEGSNTLTTGNTSHAEGINTVAGVGDRPTISTNTEAGNYAHAEGNGTQASGNSAHAEGKHTLAEGSYSHAEGINTRASGQNSHAEGHSQTNVSDATVAKSNDDIIEDWNANKFTLAKGAASHAEGKDNLAFGARSHAEGYQTIASGANSHSENYNTIASGANSHAEGASCEAKGERSHVEGFHTETNNASEHAEGSYNKSNTDTRHSIGIGTSESGRKNAFEVMKNGDAYLYGVGDYEGNNLKTDETKPSKTVQDVIKSLEDDSVWERGSGENSVQQKGTGAVASGKNSHAEGRNTTASNSNSHAEGNGTTASGYNSHSEGIYTYAYGNTSHAEGYQTKARGSNSHAEGYQTIANGYDSHAEGTSTITQNPAEHAEGQYNKSNQATDALGSYGNAGNTQHSVGIGTDSNDRKNAHEIMQNGDHYIYGLGGYDGTNPSSAKTLQQVIAECGSSMTEINYAELKTLRDNSQLIKGMQYRITDYVTTTVQSNTQSAGHQFDVIVVADSTNTLNENARAIQHEGDTYFSDAGAKLESWELKYCLDNDTTRFAWADSSNGKGIIYRMVDEFNNDCPYDFKNMQFTNKSFNAYFAGYGWEMNDTDLFVRDSSEDGDYYAWYCDNYGIYCYTDTETPNTGSTLYHYNPDDDMFEQDDGNIVTTPTNIASAYTFTRTVSSVFVDASLTNNSTSLCHNNKFGEYFVSDLKTLPFMTFVSTSSTLNCYSNSFGDNCYFNTFGNECYSNTFGNNCYGNQFGNYCYSNQFGNNCYRNQFGNSCGSNTFGNYFQYNTFGNNCYYNTFGNYCNSNQFGNYCRYNTFGNECTYIRVLKDYVYYIIVENGNKYIDITSTQTTSSSNKLMNFTISQGVNNTTTYKTISHNTLNDAFKTTYQSANSQTIDI